MIKKVALSFAVVSLLLVVFAFALPRVASAHSLQTTLSASLVNPQAAGCHASQVNVYAQNSHFTYNCSGYHYFSGGYTFYVDGFNSQYWSGYFLDSNGNTIGTFCNFSAYSPDMYMAGVYLSPTFIC